METTGIRVRAALLALCAASAAVWAGVLVDAHRRAVLHLLEPGVLCGADGGCEQVLASPWSAVAGVPVSAPAIFAYGVLAVVAAAVAAGSLSGRRAAGVLAGTGLGGVAVAGGLLVVMLGGVGHVCRYCLVMDTLAVTVAVLAVTLHPEGLAGALRAIPRGLPGVAGIGALAAVGSSLLAVLVPEPVDPDTSVVVLHEGEPRPTVPEGTRIVVIPKDAVPSPIEAGTPVQGPASAPLEIVVFEDFECPYCRRLTANLHQVLEEQPGRWRVAFRHFPMHRDCNDAGLSRDLHPDACRAAAAAVCAQRQDRFWDMYGELFGHPGLSEQDIAGYARELGLEAGFDACVRDPSSLAPVRADSRAGGALGITGTPTFFVNGRRFVGAMSVAALEAIGDALEHEPAPPRPATPPPAAAPGTAETLGAVTAPAEVRLEGPRGEFTIDAYEASLDGARAVSRPGVEPARGLTWTQADAACRAAGKRLCAEDEWLTACTGEIPADDDHDGLFSEHAAGRAHPYGATPDPTRCASARTRNDPRPLLTGEHPGCVTPEGIYDLEGGVKEWVGLTIDRAALQGGSYYSGGSARCAYHREADAPDTVDRADGFRCCSGPAPALADHHPGGKVGDHVLDWSLPTVGGGTISAASLAGKPYVLTFWASWCGPCRKELPELAKLYASTRESMEIVAIDIDEVEAQRTAYLARSPLPFPVAIDPNGAQMAAFDTRGTPTTFWVTRSGLVRQRTVGYDADHPELLAENARDLLRAD